MEKGLRGRKLENKALIVVAAQQGRRGIGRIRMKRIMDASAEILLAFVEECFEPGSVVHTDGWPAYSGLERKGLKWTPALDEPPSEPVGSRELIGNTPQHGKEKPDQCDVSSPFLPV